ncbi:MAG: hypothetical protein Q8O41_01425 [Candidatus Methanoperedens sp.]|nr:hypothetical protein [Candidatus Methanoperedens sp.]
MLKNVKETAAWERSRGEFSVIEVPAIIVSIQTFVHLQKEAEKILGFDGAAVLFYEAGKSHRGSAELLCRAWLGEVQR